MHPGIHEYAEKLTAKLPGNLKVSPALFSSFTFTLVVCNVEYWTNMLWSSICYWIVKMGRHSNINHALTDGLISFTNSG